MRSRTVYPYANGAILMRAMMAGLALAMMTSTTALAADQFDLVCSGTRTYMPGSHTATIDERFSIDLTRKQWCQQETGCKVAYDLKNVSVSELVLKDRDTPKDSAHFIINRTDGSYVYYGYSSIGKESGDGKCESAPFTPMPGAKF